MNTHALSERAAILSEAMPYLRRYTGKVVVVKFGGHAMVNQQTKKDFAADIVLLQQCGIRIVVVHGGGPQIGVMLKKLNINSSFVGGLRVTDAATMEIAEMILAGSINKDIVALIQSAGGQAVGLSGKDGQTIIANRITRDDQGQTVDLGFVGTPAKVNTTLISHLFEGGFIPVIAPIGYGHDGESLNINSDTAAGALAAQLQAKRLLLLSDIPGVLDTSQQLIHQMNLAETRSALTNGIATGGMIPKLQTCLETVEAGVEAAVVLDGRNNHATLIELLSDQGSGTLIADFTTRQNSKKAPSA